MFRKSVIVLALLGPVFAADPVSPAAGVTVHEWGTFTSVAGELGEPVYWSPLTAPSDLPCFVNRLPTQCVKCAPSIMRMETPVLYFYSAKPATVSVKVDFPSGLISEWYPRAADVSPKGAVTYERNGRIDWGKVEIGDSAFGNFPKDDRPSHYYAARETDSAALRVNGQEEKLLFYRGVASDGVYLAPRILPDGRVEIRRNSLYAVPRAILFENRDGNIGYRVVRDLSQPVTVDAPKLGADVREVHRELAQALEGAGLYPKEAAAMIETWRDSWFEDGLRVFYLVPKTAVDFLLPLRIEPAPVQTTRVFAGRVELLSNAMRQNLQTALANGDIPTLAKCGRFFEPFMAMMHATPSPEVRSYMNRARQAAAQPPAPCKAAPFATQTDGPLQ